MRALHLIGSLAFAGALTFAHAAEAQTLRAISFIPKNDPVLAMANAWVSEVNSKLSGQLRLNYVGGPEVITRFQQVEALRTGVVDVLFPPSGDYQDQMPTSQAFVLSKLTPSEERKSGFYDFMVEEHARKINARYLGRIQISPFYLWTKKEPKALADLRGLKMRSGVLYDRLMREFGMVPVTINAPEVYTALQSGIVDGFGWPVTGPLKRGWLELGEERHRHPVLRREQRRDPDEPRQVERPAEGVAGRAVPADGRVRAAHGQAFQRRERERVEGDRRQGEEGQVPRRGEQDLPRHRL